MRVNITKYNFLRSVAGSVIRTTWKAEFKDGSRKGSQSEARSSLQRVGTKPENKSIIFSQRTQGCEAKSLKEVYQLSFLEEGVHSNKQTKQTR